MPVVGRVWLLVVLPVSWVVLPIVMLVIGIVVAVRGWLVGLLFGVVAVICSRGLPTHRGHASELSRKRWSQPLRDASESFKETFARAGGGAAPLLRRSPQAPLPGHRNVAAEAELCEVWRDDYRGISLGRFYFINLI